MLTIRVTRIWLGLVLAAIIAARPSHADGDMQFVLHNLHFQEFDAYGFQAPAVAHSVHQDSKGRLWIGTEDGLFLYDGHEVRTFEVGPGEHGKLPHGFVKTIAEDPDGTVWLGTWGGGIAYFDERSRQITVPKITRYRNIKPEEFDPKIWSMDIDDAGRVWIGTFASGLFRFDPATGELALVYRPGPDEHPRANRIDSVYVDDANRVWAAPISRQVRVFHADSMLPVDEIPPSLLVSPTNRGAYDFGRFPDGRLFILYENVLRIFNATAGNYRDYRIPTKRVDGPLMEGVAYTNDSMLFGTAERLWYFHLPSTESFPIPTGKWPGGMESSIVWDMDVSPRGDIFVAGNTGLWITPAASRAFWTVTQSAPESAALIETRAILREGNSLFLNSEDRIFEIEFNGTLDRPRVLTGSLFSRPPIGYPLWMVAAPENCFWIGADIGLVHSCKGNRNQFLGRTPTHVLLYDDVNEELLAETSRGLGHVSATQPKQLVVRTESAPQNGATWLSFGMHEDIMAGTFNGLARYDRQTHQPLPVFEDGADKGGWIDPFTLFVIPQGPHAYFVGTTSGLYRAHIGESGKIRRMEKLFVDTPFENVSFSAMLAIDSGHPVFVTAHGYLSHNMDSGETSYLLYDDGAPTYDVYGGGFREFDDGIAILSGLFGPILVKPEELSFDHAPQPLVVSEISSFRDNQLVSWSQEEQLVFEHEDRVIRFKFGLLDYLVPENNHYQVRLTGFSKKWLDIGRLGEFNFTDLDAGNYRLDMRADDGAFDSGAEISVRFLVLPPWWLTWWAYAAYALIFFGALFWYWFALQRKLEREKETSARLREADRIKSHFLSELEEKVELATQDLRHAVEAMEIKNVELDAAQQRALDASRLKSEFLANMSHEIRTPMNGILGFTQLLAKSPLDHDQRDYLETIDKSATSLLGIINDVLDVSKIEAGKLMIDNTGFDLRQCISDTLDALTPIAYEKNLELIGHVDADLPDGLRGDPVRLRQMVTNLVGNAVKFTESGHVLVHVKRHTDDTGKAWLHVGVTDTGPGITAKDRERLFQAFERGNVSLSGRHIGTGLGLVITKKLCEAMGGRIELDSVPGEGTRIMLELPLVPDRNPENRYGHGKPLAGRKILLIDANDLSREALRARLVHWGATVSAFAELVMAPDDDTDMAVIGIERTRLGDTAALHALCERLPPSLPRLCLAASIDHEALRSLGTACNAICIQKVGHRESQLRRILDLLGVTPQELEIDAAPADRQSLRELRVLVADDNRINRYYLKKILELHGASVTGVDSGAGVLRALEENDGFDIVLLDVHMPDMDGLEVARRIRAGGNTRLPLLAVSANIQAETHEAAVTAGINDYLLKPVKENKLVEAILEWTGREEIA